MNSLSHYGTCRVWSTGNWLSCNCQAPPWRIRKEPDEQFPWRVWRRTGDDGYVPLIRASSWDRAFELIKGMVWLREQALQAEEPCD